MHCAPGAIQAAVVGPAEVVRGKKEGFKHLIDLTTKNVEYQGSVMAMTEDLIAQEDTALRIIRAMIEGLHFFKTRRDESVRIMSAYLKGADIDAMKQGWVRIRRAHLSRQTLSVGKRHGTGDS